MTRKRFKKLLMARGYSPKFSELIIKLCQLQSLSYSEQYKNISSIWKVFDEVNAGTISLKDGLHILGIGREYDSGKDSSV